MSLHLLLFRYILFAILATISNLVVQRAILQLGDSVVLFLVAVFLGTLVGLVVKFSLDKKWIFLYRNTSPSNNSHQFMLYSATGVFTTIVFWGSETLFWLVFSTDGMRELGAIIGLSIGYVLKYQLDRRYVFTNSELRKI